MKDLPCPTARHRECSGETRQGPESHKRRVCFWYPTFLARSNHRTISFSSRILQAQNTCQEQILAWPTGARTLGWERAAAETCQGGRGHLVIVRDREVSSPVFLLQRAGKRNVLQLRASSQPPRLSLSLTWRTGVFPVLMPLQPLGSAWNLLHSGLLSLIHLCCPWLFMQLETYSTNGNNPFSSTFLSFLFFWSF